mgnify:CR=1 FL=1
MVETLLADPVVDRLPTVGRLLRLRAEMKLPGTARLEFEIDPELFRSAKADMNSVYDPLIASIARIIVENVEFVGGVTVVGHTDSRGTDEYNQGLSERRAGAARTYLMSQGISPDRIEAVGRGETEPVDSNDSDTGRQANRRVEITMVPVTAS